MSPLTARDASTFNGLHQPHDGSSACVPRAAEPNDSAARGRDAEQPLPVASLELLRARISSSGEMNELMMSSEWAVRAAIIQSGL